MKITIFSRKPRTILQKEAVFCFDNTNKLVSWLTKSWIDASNSESRDMEMVLSIHMRILLRISLQETSAYSD
jgi:hypothetical protein